MRTRKDEDCTDYKEVLNAATTEMRKFVISYAQKVACNIKHDSKISIHMPVVSKTYDTRLDL